MLSAMRHRVSGRVVRVWVGHDGYDIRRARIDPIGVVFAVENERGVPAWQSRGANGDNTRPLPIRSPIPWDRIERLETRHSSAARGATYGAWILGAACYAASYAYFHDSDQQGFLLVSTVGGFVAGAIVGGAVGGCSTHSEALWRASERRR
jgi:hypothetical protein